MLTLEIGTTSEQFALAAIDLHLEDCNSFFFAILKGLEVNSASIQKGPATEKRMIDSPTQLNGYPFPSLPVEIASAVQGVMQKPLKAMGAFAARAREDRHAGQ